MNLEKSYTELFNEAFDRTIRNGLNVSVIRSSDPEITLEKFKQIQYIVSCYSNRYSIEPINACIRFNFDLAEQIEKILNSKCVLTIGDVRISGHCDMYNFDEKICLELLEKPSKREKFPFHCWLTLPSNLILDITIKSNIIFTHSPEGAIHYIPIILGEDFLYKVGAARSSSKDISFLG